MAKVQGQGQGERVSNRGRRANGHKLTVMQEGDPHIVALKIVEAKEHITREVEASTESLHLVLAFGLPY